jgi:hypothetical protein
MYSCHSFQALPYPRLIFASCQRSLEPPLLELLLHPALLALLLLAVQQRPQVAL